MEKENNIGRKDNRGIKVYGVASGDGGATVITTYVKGFSCFSVVEIEDKADKRGDGGVEASGINRKAAFLYFINGKKEDKGIIITIIN